MNNPQIFMCHASEDKQAVLTVYNRLKNEGFEPWLDKENLLPGQIWGEEIPKAIRASDFVLVFLSTSSVYKRGYVQKEFKIVLDVLDEIPEGRIFVIPVKLDDCEVPARFSHLHWSNLYEAGSLEKIIESIQRHVAHTGLRRSSLEAAREPLETALEHARESIGTLETRLFEIPGKLVDKYRNFLDDKSAGVTRILPEGKYERLLGIQHGGAWFSFSRRTHDAHNEADITLRKKRSGSGDFALKVGFKGLHYGFLLPLGDMPILNITSDSTPPRGLPQKYHLAWSHMWLYEPPLEVKKLRIEGYKFGSLGGVKVGDVNLTDEAPLQPASTFLLRSVNHRVSDLLLALRVEERMQDDSVILLWKILAQYKIPDGTGPEPYGFDLADTLADETLAGARKIDSECGHREITSIVKELHPKALRFLKKLNNEEARGHLGKMCYVGDLIEHSKELLTLQTAGLVAFWPRVNSPDDVSPHTSCFLTTAGSTVLDRLQS